MRILSLQKLLTGVFKGVTFVHPVSRHTNGLVPPASDLSASNQMNFRLPFKEWLEKRIETSNQIPKPHISREGLDNSDTPFVPTLRHGIKPNAIVRPNANTHTNRLHPYHEELQTVNYPETVFTHRYVRTLLKFNFLKL